jgi:hypothetical protein
MQYLTKKKKKKKHSQWTCCSLEIKKKTTKIQWDPLVLTHNAIIKENLQKVESSEAYYVCSLW